MECSHPSSVLAHFGALGMNHRLQLSHLGIPIHQHPSKKLQGKQNKTKKNKINIQLPSILQSPVPDSDEIRDFCFPGQSLGIFPYIENNPTQPPTAYQDLS